MTLDHERSSWTKLELAVNSCRLNCADSRGSNLIGGALEPSIRHNMEANPRRICQWRANGLIVALAAAILSQATALKVSLAIPELVKLNDAFWLNCSHHEAAGTTAEMGPADREDIYAIKWYKDDEEFYRYLPSAQPKVSIYETNGIQLDQSKSQEGNVFITKADVNSEGNYRCEILSEAPSFETVRKSKHLKVYALPVRGPRIEILDANGRVKSPKAQEISYAVGDKIDLRCNSAPSKPAARLRWYLNDYEITIPGNSTDRERRASKQTNVSQQLKYDARVTPIEYRQHYKGIYSSHSSLSLVLQQDDLINNKISFKCLASMRQDVPIRSKQLIVLTPTKSTGLTINAQQSAKLSRILRSTSPDLVATLGSPESEAHVHHRQRPQHYRHSVSRLPAVSSSSSQAYRSSQLDPKSVLSSELIKNLPEELKNNQMMYIYEDSDSTLGASIIDGQTNLASYLLQQSGGGDWDSIMNNNYGLEFNKADNLEYMQMIRERAGYPTRSQLGAQPIGTGSNTYNSKRSHGPSSLIKSPLYLDENDPQKPIIGWPPLDSGRLILLPPGNTIVAIPTPTKTRANRKASTASPELKIFLPSKVELDSIDAQTLRFKKPVTDVESSLEIIQIMLDRLVHNLNCTCAEGSVDMKLNWLINDLALSTRDTICYPMKGSPDNKQTCSTIGMSSPLKSHSPIDSIARVNPMVAATSMQSSTPTMSATTLQSVLSQYSNSKDTQNHATTNGVRFDTKPIGSNPQSGTNDQIKFTCQAVHSMLLYSSSEMITFDFNPPPPTPVDDNSIDKLATMPSNVIQAASASQSSSAHGGYEYINLTIRSQSVLFSLIIMVHVYITSRLSSTTGSYVIQ